MRWPRRPAASRSARRSGGSRPATPRGPSAPRRRATHDVGLAAPPQALRRFLDRHPAQDPVAVARLLHRDVVRPCPRRRRAARVRTGRASDPSPASRSALLEPPHVEQAGRVDVAAVDVGHPVIGTKIRRRPNTRRPGPAPAAGGPRAHRRHEVAHLADLVALGVEDRQPDEAGDEDAAGRAHVPTLYRPGTRGPLPCRRPCRPVPWPAGRAGGRR